MGHNKPTQLQNAGRVARKAAEIIRDRGHAIGSMETRDGKVCALRAFSLAIGPEHGRQRLVLLDGARKEFCDWLQMNYPGMYPLSMGVPGWNDRVLKEETPLWLDKFADAVDPQ